MLSLIKQSKFQRLQKIGTSRMNYVQCEQGCAVTNQAHLKYIECQMKMVSSLWQTAKINKLENVEENF